jgi:hypothetical protein
LVVLLVMPAAGRAPGEDLNYLGNILYTLAERCTAGRGVTGVAA